MGRIKSIDLTIFPLGMSADTDTPFRRKPYRKLPYSRNRLFQATAWRHQKLPVDTLIGAEFVATVRNEIRSAHALCVVPAAAGATY